MGARSLQQPFGIRPPGFRLPDATHVGGLQLQVSDLERALRFYQAVLGFRVLSRDAQQASLGAEGSEAALLTLHAPGGVRPSPGGTLGLYHFAIVLPDRAALGRFARHLSELRVRAGSADHLVSEAIYLGDPDGLGIEVYADRPRSEWRVDGRELTMTTEPLDTGSLAASAGEGRWQGLPAGTAIGHVHLHVGDLRQAEAFYHAALGFDKVVWSYPGALFFSAGGYHHHLGTNTWGRPGKPSEDVARLLRWELVLPSEQDAADAARSLGEKGAPVERTGEGWATADPWGTPLLLRAKM